MMSTDHTLHDIYSVLLSQGGKFSEFLEWAHNSGKLILLWAAIIGLIALLKHMMSM